MKTKYSATGAVPVLTTNLKNMKIKNWNVNIWKSYGFSFLFHYEWKWNEGSERRLYILWWEINFSKEGL